MGCIYFEQVSNYFVSKPAVTQNIFVSCSTHCDQRLIFAQVYYFQIWNKNEHKIFIDKLKSHMGPMYIETAYICIHMGPVYTETAYTFRKYKWDRFLLS